MIDQSILDEMDLPLTNPKEELETISKNFLLPKFDVEKFELRPEIKDKGIDINGEIKRNGKHINFRFVIQLKATESIKANQDGTISLQIHTSNINYLLNGGIPAYYILYSKTHKKFFYEHLNEFVKYLENKDSDWRKQETHVLRFAKELNESEIMGIYDTTIKKGLFQREINEKLAQNSASIDTGDKILFDKDLNITEDSEIRNLIENIGLSLINEGKWKEIIIVHGKASQNIANTAKYNLVLGIANYYSGNLIESLNFFKYAIRKKDELTNDLSDHLIYFDTLVKFYMGIISEADYRSKMSLLEQNENIGLYLKIEKSKQKYFDSVETDSLDPFEEFERDILTIINDPKVPSNIKLISRCELILIQGSRYNMDYVRSISKLNAWENFNGPDISARQQAAMIYISLYSQWFNSVNSLMEEAKKEKNYFTYFCASINSVKVSYERMVFTDLIFVIQDIPGMPKAEMPDKKPSLKEMLSKLNEAYQFFNQIGHIENIVVTLSTKYELLHYFQDYDNASKILSELEDLIDNYDLNEHKKKIIFLKNSGTTHEQFKIWIDDINAKSEKEKKEHRELTDEMIKMDEEDKVKVKDGDILLIQLFPIGIFQFSSNKKDDVYKILNLNAEEVRKQFDSLHNSGIVPIANILYNPITQEGLVDGMRASKGMTSYRNIHRIRKAFFENKFYKL